MSATSITREEGDTKGRYVAQVAGRAGRGEMTYSRAGDTLIIVDHTDVDDSLRGLGVGAALAERLVADARAEGRRLIPLCPFFQRELGKHPEWRELL